jgi:hypothetical protein
VGRNEERGCDTVFIHENRQKQHQSCNQPKTYTMRSEDGTCWNDWTDAGKTT